MARKRARPIPNNTTTSSQPGDTTANKSESSNNNRQVIVTPQVVVNSGADSTIHTIEPAEDSEPERIGIAMDKSDDEVIENGGEDEDEDDKIGEESHDDDDEDDDNLDDGEDDYDSEGDMRDYRKRFKRKRDRDRAAAQGSVDEDTAKASEALGPSAVKDQEFPSDGAYRNKQRVLLFSSRGITSRFRHLLADLRQLVPHHKKDVKLDFGKRESLAGAVNEIAEIKSCNSCVFLECRKKTDLYLWAGKTPTGPSAKFHVLNVHTMDELKLTGNCMLGSRPLLSFDANFDQKPHWKVLKGILTDVFNTPRGHPKSKPFIDRIMSFFVADGKIWVRNYQIVDKGDGTDSALNRKIENSAGEDALNLVEIGPRFVLNPIRVFVGSFGGPTLYNNSAYISPNHARAAKKRSAGVKFEARKDSKKVVKTKKAEPAVPKGPLDDVFKA